MLRGPKSKRVWVSDTTQLNIIVTVSTHLNNQHNQNNQLHRHYISISDSAGLPNNPRLVDKASSASVGCTLSLSICTSSEIEDPSTEPDADIGRCNYSAFNGTWRSGRVLADRRIGTPVSS